MATFTGSLNDIKSQWFASKGFVSNDLNTQIRSYLAANGGGASRGINDMWYTFLAGKGRTGSITDMYKAELIASLAGANSKMSITDLEKMFYSTSTNTFA